MAGFFHPDSKPYQFMERLTDVVMLSLLWLLFSLPVITLGASTIAVSAVTLKMAEDTEGKITEEFLKAFKSNLKQGIAMTFITLICLTAVILDFLIMNNTEGNSVVFLIIGVVSAYIFTFSLLYAYPLLARYENTVFAALKNSFEISMRYFLRSLLLVVIVGFELAVIMWNGTTQFVGVLIGPAFITFTVSAFAIKIFRELEKIPGTVRETKNEENEQH